MSMVAKELSDIHHVITCGICLVSGPASRVKEREIGTMYVKILIGIFFETFFVPDS